MDPSNAQAEVALGAALALLGDRDAGIARMRHGIKLSPRDRMLGFWGWALGLFLLHANRGRRRSKRPISQHDAIRAFTYR